MITADRECGAGAFQGKRAVRKLLGKLLQVPGGSSAAS